MLACQGCTKHFHNDTALHAHCRDRSDHAYCVACERLFVHETALSQHLQNASVHQDDDDYESSNDDYSSDEDDEDEDEDEDEDFCDSCNRTFVNKQSLYQHLASSLKHNWCFLCSRDFSTESALDQHTSSRVHNGRDFYCPLCSKGFKIPSSIALHIESGACGNISRHQVTSAVHSLKLSPTISISGRIQNTSRPLTITHYSASERAFNGTAYECYLCHSTFRSLSSLNAHLGSPAHDKDQFKCPKCKVEFKLVSGLIQHIESEKCGVARFKQVEDYATALTQQFSRLLMS